MNSVLKLIIIFILNFVIVFSESSSKIIYDDTAVIYKGKNKSQLIKSGKILISQKKDREHGELVVLENDYQKLKKLNCILYDKNGKKIKKYTKKDCRIIDASQSYVLFSGVRYYVLFIEHLTYPYTIEYSYTVNIKSNFLIPDWLPQTTIPIEKSSYSFIKKKGLSVNTKLISDSTKIHYTEDGDTYTWTEYNIPRRKSEYLSAPEDNISYGMYITPNYFDLEGVAGTFKDWRQFSNWYYRLSVDQIQFNDLGIPVINSQDEMTTAEKIQYLYQFVQKQTRYVAIELGIHGWKPHSSLSVLKNKYGDCKDLTMFFISCLRANGIEAYPALILTRGNGIVDENFPMNNFNHVITYIPTKKDTFWVDCTSDEATIYDLPFVDEGCNVLVIKNVSGEILRTPISSYINNKLIYSISGKLSNAGSLNFEGNIIGYGNYNQDLRFNYSNKTENDKRNMLIKRIGRYFPKIELLRYSDSTRENNNKPMTISFAMNANNVLNKTGERIFFNPPFIHQYTSNYESPESRETGVYLSFPKTIKDSISITYPEEYLVESLPEDVLLDYSFGSYSYYVNINENVITLKREYILYYQKVNKNNYSDLYEFNANIEKSERRNIVFLSKQK